MFGISPIYNAIVVDLSHIDDITNEAFINGTLSFGPIILMNYLKYEDSLTLNSTFDTPTSRPQTKRHIDIKYQGGEGVAFLNDEHDVKLRCSAGVLRSIILKNDNILTSGRCFPEDVTTQFIYHMPWYHPEVFNFFGILSHISYTGVDFAMIQRIDHDIDLPPQIRSSDVDFPSLFIESFGNNPTVVGGTVFSYIPSTKHQRVETYGIVTHFFGLTRGSIYGGEPIVVTTIQGLREFRPASDYIGPLTFIDLVTYASLT
ncbi:17749_t:CDS:2 [Gigaspora margarita]|uniref:17749_t:CDS:1 n=1 Tax=Gigaspora margarita TaxID=4874 RepID=A0ABN7VLX9_GIGMA|nr:17749_t:CDS:2 [Gigaspora margarita]